MIVFGKRDRPQDPRDLIAEIAGGLGAARDAEGLRRHEALAAALIAAGMLLQGLADADLSARGTDAPSPAQDGATGLILRLAEAVLASWAGGFHRDVPDLDGALAELAGLALPPEIATRWAEGFAFYAIYPETYGIAARTAGLAPDTLVIGLRSIGAPLAAMVAAGIGSRRLLTVRPVGHPFRRHLALSEAVEATIRAARNVAVVDEGPGLSGSSFGAVLDALDRLGVAEDRVTLFPSHDGMPGPQASEKHRRLWARIARRTLSFDAWAGAPERPDQALGAWVTDLVGGEPAPLEDMSGGGWRRQFWADPGDWSPVNAWQERRKFLMQQGNTTWHIKFVGLGSETRRKHATARALQAAGFIPEVAGLRHGFLVERWHGEAVPLRADQGEAWIARIGDYLAFRATAFPAPPEAGADLSTLVAMARHNAGEALGAERARALERWSEVRLAALERGVRRVETDNRMQPWKWLTLPDGRLLKADALDHAAGHDLIGAQDIAWDLAAAIVEFDLPKQAGVYLQGRVEVTRNRPLDPALIDVMLCCYVAYQIGALTLAEGATRDPAEAARLGRRRADFRRRLHAALDAFGG
ncbi:hypothetical protein [Methylobacterium sp. Leaf117]|uniref:hypothetical protein n=1 Tax=Methylobacterium sp. Leaf117 TaxID=1736260 RepID=UPI000B2B6C9C|nr:hypothetical protein [Methylobacterium sp. Leaf117]